MAIQMMDDSDDDAFTSTSKKRLPKMLTKGKKQNDKPESKIHHETDAILCNAKVKKNAKQKKLVKCKGKALIQPFT